MNLIEFVKNFPDEESYKRKWREIRERQGVVCPKCGCREHYWKNDKQSFIWSMVHKLRDTMGKRDDRYMLDGEIEIDT